jgi:hypothetical protein
LVSITFLADADELHQENPEDTMNNLNERILTLFSFIKETFDLDPANLWLR